MRLAYIACLLFLGSQQQMVFSNSELMDSDRCVTQAETSSIMEHCKEHSAEIIKGAALEEEMTYSSSMNVDWNADSSAQEQVAESDEEEAIEQPVAADLIIPTNCIEQFGSEAAGALVEAGQEEELAQEDDNQPSVEKEEIADYSSEESAIGGSAASKEVELYSQLPITSEERKMIGKLLNSMAENSVFKLIFEKKKLERIGRRIHHIHPMRFLGTVFTDRRLVYCMHEIHKSGFKWDGFVNGFSGRMKEEAGKNNLAPYVAGFSTVVGVNPQEVTHFVLNKDFEGLVKYLLYAKYQK